MKILIITTLLSLRAFSAMLQGIMMDPRDGTTYKVIKIGHQIWMAENLKYEIGKSWCYDDNPRMCEYYGRLYDWATAKGACPEKWHLPSDEEWTALSRTTSSDTLGLLSKKMQGTNSYDFSILPGGYRFDNGTFQQGGNYAVFWSATPTDFGVAWARILGRGAGMVRMECSKISGFSVRCVNDY
jgi:uncharacterized protein (TIGR02145 family)